MTRIQNLYLLRETTSALQVQQGIRGKPVWLPKSQLGQNYLDKSDRPLHSKLPGWVEMPSWLVEEKDFL